jgi:TatD DNase family protein
LFINIHTHSQIYDAKLEIVNGDIHNTKNLNYYSYGLHPWYINDETIDEDLRKLRFKVTEKNCLAIGECGLDKLSKVDFDKQLFVFKEQIKLANDIKKPLIIHCVKAFNELINCLNLNNNEMPVIVHGYNNNENIARVLKDYGCFFSFGKALLGYESNASKVIKNIGKNYIFLETDDAELSIKYVYNKASELLGVNLETVQEQIRVNFESVFGKQTVTLK